MPVRNYSAYSPSARLLFRLAVSLLVTVFKVSAIVRAASSEFYLIKYASERVNLLVNWILMVFNFLHIYRPMTRVSCECRLYSE